MNKNNNIFPLFQEREYPQYEAGDIGANPVRKTLYVVGVIRASQARIPGGQACNTLAACLLFFRKERYVKEFY